MLHSATLWTIDSFDVVKVSYYVVFPSSTLALKNLLSIAIALSASLVPASVNVLIWPTTSPLLTFSIVL